MSTTAAPPDAMALGWRSALGLRLPRCPSHVRSVPFVASLRTVEGRRLLVVRHEMEVLRRRGTSCLPTRQSCPPGVLSLLLPRSSWETFAVTRATLLGTR
jgi:hypothetical protein